MDEATEANDVEFRQRFKMIDDQFKQVFLLHLLLLRHRFGVMADLLRD